MTSRILIINRALIKLGAQPLLAETDNTQSGRTMTAIYDAVLDRLLRSYRWSFAIKRVRLPMLTATPAFGYAYQYQLPTDCLRIDEIDYLGGLYNRWCDGQQWIGRPLYQIESNTIQTDMEAPVNLRYGARITDPYQYDPCFAEALASMLAREACDAITQSTTKTQAMQQLVQLAISEARAVSAIERPTEKVKDTSWYTARF